MKQLPLRLQREFKTIERMAAIYCRAHHGTSGGLCDDCRSLVQYAHNRLEHCPYQEEKSACANCPTHCYAPHRREQVREVMRFAGPRMMLRHPILALLHQIDNLRKTPPG